MSELKSNLEHVRSELKALEERARKLKNQNLADVAASAHGKVLQLSEHPDLELVDEKPASVSEFEPTPQSFPGSDPIAPPHQQQS